MLGTSTVLLHELKNSGKQSIIYKQDGLHELLQNRSLRIVFNNQSKLTIDIKGRMRLKLSSPNPDGRTAGFITLSTWGFDITNIPGSSESTPFHTASFKMLQNQKVIKRNYHIMISHSDLHLGQQHVIITQLSIFTDNEYHQSINCSLYR